jgi:outer membrane lipopolysaccharide assembly protein LptE/RlpB
MTVSDDLDTEALASELNSDAIASISRRIDAMII